MIIPAPVPGTGQAVPVPDRLRADDLTGPDRLHRGRLVSIGGHVGRLHDAHPVDNDGVQLLLIPDGAHPIVPIVPVGALVELLD